MHHTIFYVVYIQSRVAVRQMLAQYLVGRGGFPNAFPLGYSTFLESVA